MVALEAAALPYLVCRVDLEVADWPTAVASQVHAGSYAGVHLLPRRHGLPMEVVALSRTPAQSVTELADQLTSAVDALPAAGDDRNQHQAASGTPSLTVVICTHGAAPGLAGCLAGLVAQTDQVFDVLVVDNTPRRSTAITNAATSFVDQLTISLIHQPTAGLSNARNAAIAEVGTDVLAWIDDDEEPDESWVAAIRQAFAAHPHVSCLTGRMLPGRLQTTTDILFEEFGGHNKGRSGAEGFDKKALGSRIFYPLPPFGAGGNMAMRRDAFQQVTSFDPLLGAGSRCGGGEDTLFFSELLDAGMLIRYEPTLVTWHFHRETRNELAAQLKSYGHGLGAYYAALCLSKPRRLIGLLRMAPQALQDQFQPTSVRNAGHSDDLRELRRGNRAAIFSGAAIYLCQRAANFPRRMRRGL